MERAQQGEPIHHVERGTLRRCPLFRDLDETAIQELIMLGAVREFGENDRIVWQDEKPTAIGVVLHGAVRVVRVAANRRELTVARGATGYVLPSAVLQGTTIVASAPYTRIIHFPQRDLRAFLAAHPAMMGAALDTLAELVYAFLELIEDIALYDVKSRVARVLRRLAQEQDCPSLDMTHQELAAMLGTRREEVTRCLGEFQARGWVQCERGRIVLHDPASLEGIPFCQQSV